MVGCPQCGTSIQPTWDWCEACGFDPEGLKPAGWRAPVAPHERPAPVPPVLRAAMPPANFGAPPPGARPQGRTTAAGYQPGGFAPPPFVPQQGYPAGMYGPPPTQGNTGGTVMKVIGAIAVCFVLLLVVLVGAVTLLGKNASSKFSRIDTAIDTPTPTTAAWSTWIAPDNSFTIDFPGVPKFQENIVPQYAHSSVAALEPIGAGYVYGVGFFDVKADQAFTDTNGALKGGIEGLVKSNGGTITSTKPSNFAGVVSIEAVVSLPSMGGGKALAMIIGKRLYVFIVFGTATGKGDYDHFVGSFHLN